MVDLSEDATDRLKNAIVIIKRELRRVEDILSTEESSSLPLLDDTEHDSLFVWRFIDLKGGIISNERFHGLWKEVLGKDGRGLGGFFSRDASLAKVSGNRVALTETGKTKLEWYKDYFPIIDEELKEVLG